MLPILEPTFLIPVPTLLTAFNIFLGADLIALKIFFEAFFIAPPTLLAILPIKPFFAFYTNLT